MYQKRRNQRKTAFKIGLVLTIALMIGGYFCLTAFSGNKPQKETEPMETQAVTVLCGNAEISALACGGTVGTLLQELNIMLGETDRITDGAQPVSLESKLYDGMVIQIDHVTVERETIQEFIPYETVTYADASMEEGETVIQTSGAKGVNQLTKELTYVNGMLTGEEIVSTCVISEPVDEVILVGCGSVALSEDETALEIYQEPEPEPTVTTAKPAASAQTDSLETTQEKTSVPSAAPVSAAYSGKTVTTSSGQVLRYSKTLTVTATAYTGGGTTATGTQARYGAIAVDPSVIPYGTKMYIVTSDGKWVYGIATAEDCGGAIRGNVVDLYFDSYDTCIQFGRRSCTVYILE